MKIHTNQSYNISKIHSFSHQPMLQLKILNSVDQNTEVFKHQQIINFQAQKELYPRILKNNFSVHFVIGKRLEVLGQSSLDWAFGLTGITAVNLTKIEASTFYASTALRFVNCSNVKTLEYSSFAFCYSLHSVTMGQILEVPDSCFTCCYSLQQIRFDSVEHIDRGAFSGCQSL